ncbi:MAG TPA: NAD(P)-dependent oxidoreductase [Opitutaceae bacterium]|nr:NAD(P)-dependent oxidoreductase [Opitutaceae bacterium]
MKKIVVTGGSGKAGRAIVRELLAHGYEVLNVDAVAPAENLCPLLRADLTNYGETVEVLAGAWGVVHMAAIPANNLFAPERTFRENTLSTFNVFQAAALLKLTRVVWASSETTLGLPFDRVQPAVMPIDEAHYPFPESTYSLSKVVGETMADQFARWSGIPFVGLRFSNVMEPHDYTQHFMTWQKDPKIRKWNLWGYIDARDAAQSARLGLEVAITGSDNFIIAAADTVMLMPNAELLAAVFPGSRLAPGTGQHETLLSIGKARRMLGFEPRYTWRDAVVK